MLQCVAVCCSVLQCVAVCCRELQRVAECCRVLQSVTQCYRVLQSLQCLIFMSNSNTLQKTAAHYNTMQHTAAHCCTLQHTATHLNSGSAINYARKFDDIRKNNRYMFALFCIKCVSAVLPLTSDLTTSARYSICHINLPYVKLTFEFFCIKRVAAERLCSHCVYLQYLQNFCSNLVE